jgi:ribosomal protein S25
MDKEKLNTFIRLLQKVQKRPNQTFDLGLIVKEPKSKIDVNEIFDKVKKMVPTERIVYGKSAIDEDVFGKIIKAFEKNKWIFLETKKDISSALLNQLKHLANHNCLKLLDYQGKDVFEVKMPESSRLIIFAERDFIENKITYPHFYRLFGPTLSIK